MASDARGLSVVEMLVSILLLGFVALGAATVLATTMHQNNLAGNRTIATHLASERIEDLTSKRFSVDPANYQLDGEVIVTGTPVTLTSDFGTLKDYPDFRRVMTLTYDSPYAGLLQVTVDVTWNDMRQGQKRHTMTTFVHPGL